MEHMSDAAPFPPSIARVVMFMVSAFLAGLVMASQCGCDGVFGIEHVDDLADAGADSLPSRDAATTDSSSASPDGSSIDAAPVTLRETTTDTDTNGNSDACYATANAITRDEIYARVFALSDFSIATAFEVTSVTFVVERANDANGIQVEVGSYAGTVGATTIDPTKITDLASVTMDAPDVANSASATAVTAMFATPAMISAGGAFVVEVVAPSYIGAGVGTFVLGGAAGGQTRPSYWGSTACVTVPPSMLDGRDNDSVGTFIIDATGRAP